MRRIIILAFYFIVTASQLVISAPVNKDAALRVAQSFLTTLDATKNTSGMPILVYTRENAFFVFASQNSWVIVAADDAVMPILAYSTESAFKVPENEADTTVGNNFWGWMQTIETEIKFVAENNILATVEIENQWENLNGSIGNKSPTTVVDIDYKIKNKYII